MALKHRIEKLEKRVGFRKSDSPAIRYICDQKDGETGAEAARKKAVAEWEAENGPLGDREPVFIEHCIVSPQPPKEAEQKHGTDKDSVPDSDAIREPGGSRTRPPYGGN